MTIVHQLPNLTSSERIKRVIPKQQQQWRPLSVLHPDGRFDASIGLRVSSQRAAAQPAGRWSPFLLFISFFCLLSVFYFEISEKPKATSFWMTRDDVLCLTRWVISSLPKRTRRNKNTDRLTEEKKNCRYSTASVFPTEERNTAGRASGGDP